MKIIQLLPTLINGDGIGNDTIAIDKIIKELGYKTKIYAEYIGPGIPKSIANRINKMPVLHEKDILIYHLSVGTTLNDQLQGLKCRKLIVYHNVTPPDFFNGYSQTSMNSCIEGIRDVQKLSNVADYCWAVSEYNRQELIGYGYKCNIDVIPIVVPFEDYDKKPKQIIIDKYQDEYVNIVFVGRVVPNKKHEDIIKTFYYYKKYINSKSRLFLVGSFNGMERYYERLNKYVTELELNDVHFTGHIKFNELLSYYHLADVFLCMSEHEGFCIPLLEAMHFEIPIIAYADTGVKDTLRGVGIGMEEKNCKVAAELIDQLVIKEDFRKNIVNMQNERLKDFYYEKTRSKIEACLKGFI